MRNTNISSGSISRGQVKAALMSLSPNPGDYVIIPGITFIATAFAVLSSGLIPVLVDTDITGHICPDAIKNAIQNLDSKPLAVIAVHLDGSSCQIEKIKALCDYYGIYLIEDVAQSFGVQREQQFLGSFGHIGCFSFQENKVISTGEGGALVSNHDELFEKSRRYSDFGLNRCAQGYPQVSEIDEFGENYKITNLSMAIFIEQIKKYHLIREVLIRNYNILIEKLKNYNVSERNDADLPLSIWVEDPQLKTKIYNNNFPFFSWSKWFIANNPAIKNKNSPYKNGFPWNLKKKLTKQDNLIYAQQIANKKVSLQIPLDDDSLNFMLKAIKKL